MEDFVMNWKNIGGALAMLAMCALIGFTIWITKSSGPLWALFLVLWFGHDFPWDRETRN